jgi:AraC family transcriptional regulator
VNHEHVEAVNRIQRYIQSNLQKKMTLHELSKIGGYSPAYTSTIFKEVVGEAVFDYMRKLRLTQAALILRDSQGSIKVIDVAFDFVFESHEGFTKAFSKTFGVNPKAYRRNPSPIKLFLPYNVRELYEHQRRERKNDMTDTAIFVQVIDKPHRKLLLKRGIKATHYFEYCDEVGCDVWGILVSVKEALYEPMGLWLPPEFIEQGTSEYVQGVEVPSTYSGVVPEGFDLIDLEPCKMMVFQGPPYEDDLFGEAIEALWQAIDRYNPKLYGFEWAPHVAPRFQLEPQGYRGYIEGRPVVSL